ncbi:MAG: RNA 2'-phosphotransferase [Pirellulales bacterium]|nr:RNA 2'-phosphotransferase [Pirellulales bacterium]
MFAMHHSPERSRRQQLVRLLAYALRHHPDDFGVSLTPAGWTDLEQFIEQIQRLPKFSSITVDEVEQLLRTSSGQRFELAGSRIRARYGHSVPGIVTGEEREPPERLFHGTSSTSLAHIQSAGLQSMGRCLVHLTSDLSYACRVAGSETSQPLVLRVAARRAHAAGVVFLQASHHVWQTTAVPVTFLTTLLQVGDHAGGIGHPTPSAE